MAREEETRAFLSFSLPNGHWENNSHPLPSLMSLPSVPLTLVPCLSLCLLLNPILLPTHPSSLSLSSSIPPHPPSLVSIAHRIGQAEGREERRACRKKTGRAINIASLSFLSFLVPYLPLLVMSRGNTSKGGKERKEGRKRSREKSIMQRENAGNIIPFELAKWD